MLWFIAIDFYHINHIVVLIYQNSLLKLLLTTDGFACFSMKKEEKQKQVNIT